MANMLLGHRRGMPTATGVHQCILKVTPYLVRRQVQIIPLFVRACRDAMLKLEVVMRRTIRQLSLNAFVAPSIIMKKVNANLWYIVRTKISRSHMNLLSQRRERLKGHPKLNLMIPPTISLFHHVTFTRASFDSRYFWMKIIDVFFTSTEWLH